jgi:hypothetical protein
MRTNEWDSSLLAFDEVALPDVVIPPRNARDVYTRLPSSHLKIKTPSLFNSLYLILT